jgi:hypothetical protein
MLGSTNARRRVYLMKVDLVLCDLHTAQEMEPVLFRHHSSDGDKRGIEVLRCPGQACTRHYTELLGYCVVGEGEVLRALEFTLQHRFLRRCSRGHAPWWMVLTRVNGIRIWVCPQENCDFTRLF